MEFIKTYKNLLALIITFIFLIWVVNGLDRAVVRQLLNNISPASIAAGSFFYFCVYLARVTRWQALLPGSSDSFKEILAITGIHNLAVRLFPNPAGELVFLQQAKQRNIPYSDSLAALIVNRTLDFVFVGLFFIIGAIPFLSDLTRSFFLFLSLSLFFISAGIGFIIFLSSAPKAAETTVSRISGFFFSVKLQKTIDQKISQFLSAFSRLKNWKIYLKAVVFSFVLWLSMFWAYFFFLKGFGLELSQSAVFIGGAIQIFANTIPNIGGLGVMEAGWTAGLTLAKVEKSVALAGALAVDLMTLTGTIILGLAAFLIKRGRIFTKIN